MFIVNNRIPVNPEHAAAFEKTFSERAGQVDGMPGFVAFQLLRPQSEDQPYVVMTTWQSRAHYEAWVNSDEFKQGHAASSTLPRETFLGRPTLETFEVIQATGSVPQAE